MFLIPWLHHSFKEVCGFPWNCKTVFKGKYFSTGLKITTTDNTGIIDPPPQHPAVDYLRVPWLTSIHPIHPSIRAVHPSQHTGCEVGEREEKQPYRDCLRPCQLQEWQDSPAVGVSGSKPDGERCLLRADDFCISTVIVCSLSPLTSRCVRAVRRMGESLSCALMSAVMWMERRGREKKKKNKRKTTGRRVRWDENGAPQFWERCFGRVQGDGFSLCSILSCSVCIHISYTATRATSSSPAPANNTPTPTQTHTHTRYNRI